MGEVTRMLVEERQHFEAELANLGENFEAVENLWQERFAVMEDAQAAAQAQLEAALAEREQALQSMTSRALSSTDEDILVVADEEGFYTGGEEEDAIVEVADEALPEEVTDHDE